MVAAARADAGTIEEIVFAVRGADARRAFEEALLC